MKPGSWLTIAGQAVWLRLTTDRLPPAGGPTTGSIGESSGPRTQIAVVGESTAAGCGVARHEEGFAGALGREVAARTAACVDWTVLGESGATARGIQERLVPQVESGIGIAVLLAGVNDVLGRRTPAEFGADLEAIVASLSSKATRVAVAGTPPFEAFPAIPRALGVHLASRATAFDRVSRQACERSSNAVWVGSEALVPLEREFFAGDGFHPSALGYHRWASVVADRILR